jgi:hypothetical protein
LAAAPYRLQYVYVRTSTLALLRGVFSGVT